MRTFKTFLKDIVVKPPVLFPIVGLFHILWLAWTTGNLLIDKHVPFGGIEWLQVLWLLLYTSFWLAATDMRKWGAIGYIVLSLINAGLYIMVVKRILPSLYISNMFILDDLCCFFLLVYFKRFR